MKIRASLSRRILAALAGLTLLLCVSTVARAQTVISSLPYTISTGGTYVLNSNLSSTQNAGNLITVNASNVTIDMQDHFITCSGGAGQSTNGIYASERGNLTIKNGTISYCYRGIVIVGNASPTTNNVGDRVLNMRVAHCYGVGINASQAPSCNITDCQVSSIGGTTYTPGIAIGINVDGTGVTVQGCSVSNVVTPSGGVGRCIYSNGGSFTRQCQVSNASVGIQFGMYQDNLASACTTPFSGGTDAGGNFGDGTTTTNAIRDDKPYYQ